MQDEVSMRPSAKTVLEALEGALKNLDKFANDKRKLDEDEEPGNFKKFKPQLLFQG